jgi:hypothetical protein
MSTHTSADRLYSGDLLIAPATGFVSRVESLPESATVSPSTMVELNTPNGSLLLVLPDWYTVEKVDRETLDTLA